jgi:hypothetical protein
MAAVVVDLPLEEQLERLCQDKEYARATFSDCPRSAGDCVVIVCCDSVSIVFILHDAEGVIADVFDGQVFFDHPVFKKEPDAVAIHSYIGELFLSGM